MKPKQHLIQLWRDTLPERFKDMLPKAYTEKTANGLTKMVIDWVRFNGGQAERISTTGRYIKAKTYKDVMGITKTIGQDKWIKGNGTVGSADISATIKGKSVKIEVKIGRDRQSEAQKIYQEAIENAGGIYYIAKDFDTFYSWYNETFK